MLPNVNSQHTLNTADRTLLTLAQSLREDGYGALADQMQVWLGGRLNVSALRTVLARLNRAHPVVTARLGREKKGPLCWRFRPGAEYFPRVLDALVAHLDLAAVAVDVAHGSDVAQVLRPAPSTV